MKRGYYTVIFLITLLVALYLLLSSWISTEQLRKKMEEEKRLGDIETLLSRILLSIEDAASTGECRTVEIFPEGTILRCYNKTIQTDILLTSLHAESSGTFILENGTFCTVYKKVNVFGSKTIITYTLTCDRNVSLNGANYSVDLLCIRRVISKRLEVCYNRVEENEGEKIIVTIKGW